MLLLVLRMASCLDGGYSADGRIGKMGNNHFQTSPLESESPNISQLSRTLKLLKRESCKEWSRRITCQ
ncbi:hypothetical protein GLYMA_11G069702v4 [Glycine max]|nr:hypothetical protein GLYMA_11G069702v4 [Glycine max]KAH1157956.1 hypothetical protein GYH30_030273 [Glycine max]